MNKPWFYIRRPGVLEGLGMSQEVAVKDLFVETAVMGRHIPTPAVIKIDAATLTYVTPWSAGNTSTTAGYRASWEFCKCHANGKTEDNNER